GTGVAKRAREPLVCHGRSGADHRRPPGRPSNPMTTDSNPFAAELDVARSAAADAAAILAARAGAHDVREKGRADLVTAVDEASEARIQERITTAFPDDAFVAEEFSSIGSATGRRWIVDPLDGTVNYVHGHPFSCVSV